jgi:hypothetical protein
MRRTVTLIVLTLAALLGGLAPASAGGPTSVLLSVPGEGRTAALYYTDPAYDELARAVGAGRALDGATAAPDGHDDARVPVTVTWLIHDVTPWRVDQVYVHDDGSTWVATRMSPGGGPLGDADQIWHRGGPGLARLLDGLLPDGNGYREDTAVAPAPQAAGEPAEATPAESPAATLSEPAGGSLWSLAAAGLGGLLVGVAATTIRLRPVRVNHPVLRRRIVVRRS